MTGSGSNVQWQDWLDDWQLSISDDGRVCPIIPARGNHEKASALPSIFSLDNPDGYFKFSIADNLFCQYILNSEIDTFGDQKEWLTADLAGMTKYPTFLSGSYHKPMRPHGSGKSEGDHVYDAWAQTFYDYRFDMLAENDSHLVKRTLAVKPSNESGSEEGFIADDEGFVMIGEGAWGAPLRTADDAKSWTLDMDSFNSFDLVHVSLNKMEIRTIDFDGESKVDSLSEMDDVFELPDGLNVWQANGGAVQAINVKDRSEIELTPEDVPVFEFGSEWVYYDSVEAPSVNWNVNDFDDSQWQIGQGQLGYGDGDETTVLDYGVDSSNKTAAYYFRKSFDLALVNSETLLSGTVVFDDALVLYVNGMELFRENMADGDVTHTTHANSSGENEGKSFEIPASFLQKGENVIAVEVHQRSLKSSDISFDLKLMTNQANMELPLLEFDFVEELQFTNMEVVNTPVEFTDASMNQMAVLSSRETVDKQKLKSGNYYSANLELLQKYQLSFKVKVGTLEAERGDLYLKQQITFDNGETHYLLTELNSDAGKLQNIEWLLDVPEGAQTIRDVKLAIQQREFPIQSQDVYFADLAISEIKDSNMQLIFSDDFVTESDFSGVELMDKPETPSGFNGDSVAELSTVSTLGTTKNKTKTYNQYTDLDVSGFEGLAYSYSVALLEPERGEVSLKIRLDFDNGTTVSTTKELAGDLTNVAKAEFADLALPEGAQTIVRIRIQVKQQGDDTAPETVLFDDFVIGVY